MAFSPPVGGPTPLRTTRPPQPIAQQPSNGAVREGASIGAARTVNPAQAKPLGSRSASQASPQPAADMERPVGQSKLAKLGIFALRCAVVVAGVAIGAALASNPVTGAIAGAVLGLAIANPKATATILWALLSIPFH